MGPTKVVSKDRVSDRDMAGDAFVETAVGEHPEGGGEMLLSVQTLIFKLLELRV